MSKYYAPDLSEFYHGCVFYIRYRDMRSRVFKPVIADIWSTGMESPRGAINMYGEDNVFMKYLDKSDIEDLGFEVKIVDMGEDTSEYPDIIIDGATVGQFYEKDSPHNGCNIELYNSFYKIKNYNELNKLQKMLGI